MDRRKFVQLAGIGASSLFAGSLLGCRASAAGSVPNFLKGYESAYRQDPLKASLDWFNDAKYGLFIHYGLYSLLGRGEWVQLNEKIRIKEYEKLKDRFTAENFDADFITDLAFESEMKYLNITTRHHDSFCLFNTKTTDFNSVNSPAKRDLVEELATACDKKGLGLCLYFSHGRDWRHPHAPNNEEWGGYARPKYDPKETYYKYGDEHDLDIYIEYMHDQLTELLTQYGPVANIWLDGHATPMSGDIDAFRIDETYALIRKLQPGAMISAKWGYNGEEDFYAPEIHWLKKQKAEVEKMVASGKPVEICTEIAGWGYKSKLDGKHRGVDSVLDNLRYANKYNGNLLLNTAPLPDGSIDKQDIATLREVGKIVRDSGWPTSKQS